MTVTHISSGQRFIGDTLFNTIVASTYTVKFEAQLYTSNLGDDWIKLQNCYEFVCCGDNVTISDAFGRIDMLAIVNTTLGYTKAGVFMDISILPQPH